MWFVQLLKSRIHTGVIIELCGLNKNGLKHMTLETVEKSSRFVVNFCLRWKKIYFEGRKDKKK